MNEDQDRNRLGNGPENLAVLRHMAINVMQKDATKGSLRGKFKRAGWDDAYLDRAPGPILKCDYPGAKSGITSAGITASRSLLARTARNA